jgi:6,7-dimethyl-8-ribityllumazine synthase
MHFSGNKNGSGLRIGIVASRWYPELMARLTDAATSALLRCGVAEDAIDYAPVPGSFELPVGAKVMLDTGRYDAVICLGVVIRGETSHYDYVAGESARGISELALATGIPVLFGVLTVENREQAIARSGGAAGDKGAEVAEAAIEMVTLFREIRNA